MMGSLASSKWLYSHFSGALNVSFRRSYLRTIKPCLPLSSAFPCRKYSSAKPNANQDEPAPQTQTSDSKSPPGADPFGIEEVVSSEGSTTLVQGFFESYGPDSKGIPRDKSKKNPQSEKVPPPKDPPAPRAPPLTQDADPTRRKRLKEYDNWLRQRMEMTQTERSDIGVAESLRPAQFGTVRVDSDNPIRSHGQYDVKSYKLGGDANSRFKSEREFVKRRNLPRNMEPIMETIEADHSTRMRASDFLKQMEQQGAKPVRDNENEDDSQEPTRNQKMVITRAMKPSIPDWDRQQELAYSSAKEDPLSMDSHVIPNEYKLPEYNEITEGDMWNILKKSIVFQNDFVLAINKPAGVPVHSKSRDCRHVIIQFLQKFAELAQCKKVYPLHRLDKESTGVLLFAKNNKIADIIKEKFKKREITKKYLAVTKLCPRIPEGCIQIPIGEGKIPGTDKYRCVLRPDLREYGISPSSRFCFEGITNYKVIHSIKEAAFLEIEPVTGYKHQIRVHLGMGLGCPVFGDHKYSHRDRLAPQRLHPFILHKIKVRQSKVREVPLHLHCNNISFTLPIEITKSSEPVYIHAKIPLHMRYTLKRLGLIR